MPRTSLPTSQELAWASTVLRKPCHVDDYGDALFEVFARFFDPLQFWYFHFFGGELHYVARNLRGKLLPREVAASIAPQMRELFRTTRPWQPADLLRADKKVVHIAELFQMYHLKDFSLEQCREQLWKSVKCDWQLGVHLFDGEVQQAGIGIGRPFSEGDFSPYDKATLEALYPHMDAGYQIAASFTRETLFGSAMAAAVEYNPTGMFILDGTHRLLYANTEARRLMQNEEEGCSELPMASKSKTVSALVECLQGRSVPVPGVASYQVVKMKSLANFPAGNLTLVVANAKPTVAAPVSARERDVILAVAELGVEQAASKLGLSAETVRTHLRNAYEKLQVDGLNEALTWLYLNGLGQANLYKEA